MKTPVWMVRNKGLDLISYLANKGPSTEYRIRNGTRMFHSTVQKTLGDLVRTGIVRELAEADNSGRQAKKYWLTFGGMVEFFHFLGKYPVLVDLSRIRDSVTIFNRLEDYPLFRRWEKLQTIYRTSIFQLFVDTGWALVENPPHCLIDYDSRHPLIRAMYSSQTSGTKVYWKPLSGNNLKFAFSFIFLTDTGRDFEIRRLHDSALRQYVESVLKAYVNSLDQIKGQVIEIESHWAKILGTT